MIKKSPRLHDRARRMMKERGEDKQIISGVGTVGDWWGMQEHMHV